MFNPDYKSPNRRERSGYRHLKHLARLGSYVRQYAWVVIAALVGLLATRILDALVPLLMKTAIDSLADAQIEPDYVWPALGIVAIVLGRFMLYVVARRVMRRVAISVTYDIRKRLFEHVQFQSPNFFNQFNTGDLMSRAVNDVGMIRMLVSFGWVNIILFVFTVATGLYFMVSLSPALTAWVVLPLPLIAITGFVMARRLFPYYRDQQEAMASVNSFTQENLNGIRTIQAMAQEQQEIERFRNVSTHYAQMVYRTTRYNAWMNLAMPFLNTLSWMVVLFYGGSLVLAGQITIGTYTAFFAYLGMVMGPISSIGMSLSMFTAAAAGTERIFQVLDFEHELTPGDDRDLPENIQGEIEFRHLSFAYSSDRAAAIDDVSLHIAAGETVAILGRVGSGKSSLLKAVVRLIDTPRNTVFIDGHDVVDYPLTRLRESATLVPQDPFLFSTTLRENLSYDDPGRAERAPKLLQDAIDAAGLSATIGELPDGIDTIVGERGMTLSGGQKQRTTLARGLVRSAPILLLDDCFSSVDTETEERILSGLARLRTGKTTVLISHRVSTARHADRIYVLEEGRIAESGSHEQLLELGGYYAALEAVQSDQDQDRARKARLLSNLRDDNDSADAGLAAGEGHE